MEYCFEHLRVRGAELMFRARHLSLLTVMSYSGGLPCPWRGYRFSSAGVVVQGAGCRTVSALRELLFVAWLAHCRPSCSWVGSPADVRIRSSSFWVATASRPLVSAGRRSLMRSRKWWTASAKPRVSVAVAQPNASELRLRVLVTPSTVIDTDSGAWTSADRPAP